MEKIDEILDKLIKDDKLAHKSRSEMLSTLSIYHEELVFQNDELKRMNQVLEDLSNEYESIFKDAPISYMILDKDFVIEKANEKSKELFERNQLLNKKFDILIDPNNQDAFYFFKNELLNSCNKLNSTFNIRVGNRQKIVKIYGNVLQKQSDKKIRLALIDMTKESLYLERIKYLSYHDQLTGLKNRRFLDQKLKDYDSLEYYPLMIVMCDVNGLKSVNDKYGHQEGDQLLINVAKALNNHFENLGVIARQSGDEFVILIPAAKNINIEEKFAKIQKFLTETSEKFKASVAFGYSCKENQKQKIYQIFKEAEDNMYFNKRNGSFG